MKSDCKEAYRENVLLSLTEYSMMFVLQIKVPLRGKQMRKQGVRWVELAWAWAHLKHS